MKIKSLRFYKKITAKYADVKTLHQYWQNPNDGENLAKDYFKLPPNRDELIVKIIKQYASRLDLKNPSIMEIGCSVGKSLNLLFKNGFTNLSGIEICPEALQILKENFTELAKVVNLYNSSAEEAVKDFKDNQFDIIYSVATLQHIHNKSAWVFKELARITKHLLITVENEHAFTWKKFARNYKKIFDKYGLKQIDSFNATEQDGLSDKYIIRIFKK